MDKQAEYGTQNGQGIAGDTVDVRPQAGALELSRIVDAVRSGQTPDPADVAAVNALQPDGGQGIAIDSQLRGRDPADLIANLHSGDSDKRRAAWLIVASILPADEMRGGVELIDDWAALEVPEREWLIPNWLPLGRVGMFSGKGGKGKTWFLLQLAAAMAAGETEWLGRAADLNKPLLPAAAGVIVFASWEDEGTEIKRRLKMMASAQKDNSGATLFDRLTTDAEGKRGFRFLDLSRRGPTWGVPDGIGNKTARLLSAGEIVRQKCEEVGAQILILDSLGYAYGGNDSDNEGVAQFLASWDSWGRDKNCSVLLVHHPPKPQSGGQTSAGYRGASSWEMHARFRWELGDGKGDKDTALLSCEKASYAMRPDPVFLERNQKTGWAWQASKDQSSVAPAGADGQCQGMTRKGEQCQHQAAEGGYCKQHQDQRRSGQSKATPDHNGTAIAAERYAGPSTTDLGG